MKLEKMEACHSWGGGVSAKTWSCCCFYSSQCNCLVSGNRTYSLDCCFTTTTLFGSKAGSFLQGSRSESLAHDDVVTEQWSSCRCTSRNVSPPTGPVLLILRTKLLGLHRSWVCCLRHWIGFLSKPMGAKSRCFQTLFTLCTGAEVRATGPSDETKWEKLFPT